jgi:CRP-like cAMP-binding protein
MMSVQKSSKSTRGNHSKREYFEDTGLPNFKDFHPTRFEMGSSKLIYLMEKYRPKKDDKNDPYGKDVEEERKFLYDYSFLFYAQSERPDIYYRSGKFLYRPVKRLRKGECFGEPGLIVYQPRTETAIAAGDLKVAVVDRKVIMSHFPEVLEEMSRRIKLIVPFFKIVNLAYVVKMAANMKEEVYEHGQNLFKEGEKINGFCIIIEGDVHLLKEISLKKYLVEDDKRSSHSVNTRKYVVIFFLPISNPIRLKSYQAE